MRNAVDCGETQEYLQEFMDASLAPDKEGRIRDHLESCPACRAELKIQREVRRRVAAEVPRREAPTDLTRRMQEILTPGPEAVRQILPRPVLRWGLAVVTLVLLSLISLALLERAGEERLPPLVIEAVNEHRSFAMRASPGQIPTADQAQVATWLEGKVGFRVDPPSGESGGLRFMGGDVTFFLERKVACLLYSKGERLVSLLILPDRGADVPLRSFRRLNGNEIYVTSQAGYGVVLWRKGNLLYAAVSELPPEELLGIAREMAQI
jgi:anti-sigma factor (TIGR02949 family)